MPTVDQVRKPVLILAEAPYSHALLELALTLNNCPIVPPVGREKFYCWAWLSAERIQVWYVSNEDGTIPMELTKTCHLTHGHRVICKSWSSWLEEFEKYDCLNLYSLPVQIQVSLTNIEVAPIVTYQPEPEPKLEVPLKVDTVFLQSILELSKPKTWLQRIAVYLGSFWPKS